MLSSRFQALSPLKRALLPPCAPNLFSWRQGGVKYVLPNSGQHFARDTLMLCALLGKSVPTEP
jgi:hypothetical protein